MSRAFPSPSHLPLLRQALLSWFHLNRRPLPWRSTRDPYAIWVSEIMLQQTRVAAVLDKYRAFLAAFPTVHSLAAAPQPAVLTLWSGLGYYRRARMLHAAAQLIVRDHSGSLPTTAAQLRTLPGIGLYTSAAIASIAHNQPVPVVDGNVERVIQRLAGLGSADHDHQSALNRQIHSIAATLLHPTLPGDFNQAMMELGATLCLPRSPQCLTCPLHPFCRTRGEHPTPRRAPMRTEPAAYALALHPGTNTTEILLEHRPATLTVMPGLWQLPQLASTTFPPSEAVLSARHAIMQVNYAVTVRSLTPAQLNQDPQLTLPTGPRQWTPLPLLPTLPLTGLTRKILLRLHLLPKS